MKMISRKQLANMFDHTLLRPDATKEAMAQVCRESAEHGFKMVAINSCQTRYCKELLKDTPVHVGAAISFPLGQTTIETKVFETQNAIEHGADEIDYVINIGKLKDGEYDYIKDEMEQIVSLCRRHQVVSKVIFENCYLTKEEKEILCNIALEVRPDFIKTSTGFGPSGAVLEDVVLMKRMVGDQLKVKVSGGVRDLKTALAMIEAGAERIGTSSSLKILEEYDRLNPDGCGQPNSGGWDRPSPDDCGQPNPKGGNAV